SRRFNRGPEAEMLRGFFVFVLSVRLRLRPFPYLPRQAASSFCCRILSFLPFSPCFPLFPNPYPGRPSEMRLETFSPHSSSEYPDTLKTNENLPGKKPVSGNMGLNHRVYNFYSCNFKN
ncbi:hypothetical protein, partial [Phocaeicola plebeius]